MVTPLLISSGVPQYLWYALLTACYIPNKIPFKNNDRTPYELWKGKPPPYKYLKVWEEFG